MDRRVALLPALCFVVVGCGPGLGADDDDTVADAGFVDAGSLDAGFVDAGSLDAGFVDAGVDTPDGGTPGRGPCRTAVDAANFFADERCISCHAGPGTTFPDLRFSGLLALVNGASEARAGRLLVVPGDLAASEVFLRIAGPEPSGYGGAWWMPAGTIGPRAAGPVEAWILADAEVECDEDVVVVPPDPPAVTNPNDLEQGALFTCADPTAPRSSPARLRRINDREFSLASGNPVLGFRSNDTVRNNPLGVQSRYSTGVADLGVDDTTLNLLLLTAPVAAQPWVTRGQGPGVGGRWWTVFDGTTNPIYLNVTPTDAERDVWVDVILRQGVLFRTPEAEESAALRALLDTEISAETAPADRATTLRTVVSAAHLMAGALFRSEMGVDPPGGPSADGRRRLGDEELGLALGRVLGAQPVSSTLGGQPPVVVDNPDWSRPLKDGRLAGVRDAVNDGSIGDPATLIALMARYRGGVDPLRVDVTTEQASDNDHDAVRRERGEYWLSEGIAAFFREWLEVSKAEDIFKEEPNATSRWQDPRSNVMGAGYSLITSPFRRETLLPLLDDTIARAVVETEASGGDVFRALLTTRTYRVPTNVGGIDFGRPCTVRADCGGDHCHLPLGFCSSFGTTEVNRVFNIAADVDDTQAARWLTMPANERAGVLTHPAFLAAHGGNFEDDASAVLRGRWIRENLLCNDVPGLEFVSVAAQLGPRGAGVRARDRVRDATEQPGSACLACHKEMNPYGYVFEVYNHAGYQRDTDHGLTPDGSSLVDNAPAGAEGLNREYADAVDLVSAFADSPYVRRCFIRNVFRYFMGRDETPADACTLTRMEAAFAGGSFFAMLDSLVTSDAFLFRTDPVNSVVGGGP